MNEVKTGTGWSVSQPTPSGTTSEPWPAVPVSVWTEWSYAAFTNDALCLKPRCGGTLQADMIHCRNMHNQSTTTVRRVMCGMCGTQVGKIMIGGKRWYVTSPPPTAVGRV